MPRKKKKWYANGNTAVVILLALGAATAKAVEEITKRFLNRTKGGKGTKNVS